MNDKLEKILEFHKGDDEQQEVIKSDKIRLIIEAPAGYGKTKTMISQIAYLITSGKLPNPKKILALTFSVNAAYKIRKDMASSAFEGFSPYYFKNKVFASNYHGFCRRVLSIYGYIIDNKLNDVKELISIDDSDIKSLQSSIHRLNYETAKFLSDFNEAVKTINEEFIKHNFNKYNFIVKNYLLNLNYITFNSILTFTIRLFLKLKELRSFTKNYTR